MQKYTKKEKDLEREQGSPRLRDEVNRGYLPLLAEWKCSWERKEIPFLSIEGFIFYLLLTLHSSGPVWSPSIQRTIHITIFHLFTRISSKASESCYLHLVIDCRRPASWLTSSLTRGARSLRNTTQIERICLLTWSHMSWMSSIIHPSTVWYDKMLFDSWCA